MRQPEGTHTVTSGKVEGEVEVNKVRCCRGRKLVGPHKGAEVAAGGVAVTIRPVSRFKFIDPKAATKMEGKAGGHEGARG